VRGVAELADAQTRARGSEPLGDVVLQGVARPAEVRDDPVVAREGFTREEGVSFYFAFGGLGLGSWAWIVSFERAPISDDQS
jgi:hypothetical protein